MKDSMAVVVIVDAMVLERLRASTPYRGLAQYEVSCSLRVIHKGLEWL